MRIEAYFAQLQAAIEACPIVQTFNVTYDKRSTHEGFIHGEIYFVDDSVLHLREFVDVEISPDRLLYVYQFMTATQQLIFRYDNTGHHRKHNLPTHPHHKHIGIEERIAPSPAPELAAVLREIQTLVLPPTL